MKQTNQEIDESRWLCWHFIKTFYLLEKEFLFLIYKKINNDLRLTPANWNNFINSKELHDYVYLRIISISEDLLCAIAYGESFGNYGMEIHTNEFTVYIAMPMFTHDNICRIGKQTAIKRQIATRVFITMLCHMFFKDLYAKPFTILKEDDGWFSLDDSYEYKIYNP